MSDKNNNGIRVSRLSTVCDPHLNEDIGILDKEQLEDEGTVELINDESCVIINDTNINRSYIIICALISFLLGFCFFVGDYINQWKGNEKGYLRTLEYAKKDYGEKFYLNPKVPEYMKAYEYISDTEEISLWQYFHIRYTDSGFYKKSTVRYDLLLDGGFFLFFFTANVCLFYFLFFSYKLAPFVIDREKKIFYTWAKGNMYVARYTQLEAVHYKNVLLLRTYSFDEDNNLLIHNFSPRIPNIHSFYIGKAYLLTFMAKYLIQGKSAVSSVNFQRQRMLISLLFTLRQEPKPTDWESQIEEILVELDKIMPPEISPDEETAKETV
ncbi:hypothetical protein ID858_05060 [Xenorhabdus sp. DI]|uniref:hypothetical protein n=1 Tax=Xenorhabdus doucetiae TaxID=351671 RepID=UPI0019B9B722|nr:MULTISPECIES: hypothetical protein [unclassified Xenorhabdus]MBD2783999.1 hypothetical protein [Xenorhabdus sp. 3]MBD2787876.1 hypothetical protein [Xenorhabdus sp. DI]